MDGSAFQLHIPGSSMSASMLGFTRDLEGSREASSHRSSNRRGLAWLSCCISAGAFGACQNDAPAVSLTEATAQAVSVSGRANLSSGEGTGLEMEVQALAIVDGPEGALGGECPVETQHRVTSKVSLDSSGNYAVHWAPAEFTPVSHPKCQWVNDSRLSIRALRLSLRVPADPIACDAFCANRLGAGCTSQCLASDGVRGTTRADVTQLLRGERGWEAKLDAQLDELTEPSVDGAPDLAVDVEATRDSWSVEEREFGADSCAVREGCLGGTGRRRLMTFDAALVNRGSAPLVIGDPARWEDAHFDACHAHYHLGRSMAYELLDATGTSVASGRKQGFCLMDTARVSGRDAGSFDCGNQGLTAGWEDLYDRALDCQWIDVTDVAAGSYTLRITANPDSVFEDSNAFNNQASVSVTLGSGGSSP